MLRQRSTEPEHFDSPDRTRAEIAAGYDELARVNRLCRLDDPYTRVLSRWLGLENCRQLSILDLGAGDAWLATAMQAYARRFGWDWRITNLDLNPVALTLNSHPHNVAASVLDLPFQKGSFDLVIASQMTHHLDTEAEVIRHFQEAWRVAKQGIFITDMQRSWVLYTLLSVVLPVLRLSPQMRADGFLSVRRSWTRPELAELVARAGLSGGEVQSYFGTRLIVQARKF